MVKCDWCFFTSSFNSRGRDTFLLWGHPQILLPNFSFLPFCTFYISLYYLIPCSCYRIFFAYALFMHLNPYLMVFMISTFVCLENPVIISVCWSVNLKCGAVKWLTHFKWCAQPCCSTGCQRTITTVIGERRKDNRLSYIFKILSTFHLSATYHVSARHILDP